MDEFKKLGGPSPLVTSETQWKNLRKDSARFQTYIWLSAKEGDVGDQLGQLDHWQEGTGTGALEGVLTC